MAVALLIDLRAVDYDPTAGLWDNRATLDPVVSYANGDFAADASSSSSWPTLATVGPLGSLAVVFNTTTTGAAQYLYASPLHPLFSPLYGGMQSPWSIEAWVMHTGWATTYTDTSVPGCVQPGTGPQRGIDRIIGNDLAGYPVQLPAANLNLCWGLCNLTADCAAWAYGVPGCDTVRRLRSGTRIFIMFRYLHGFIYAHKHSNSVYVFTVFLIRLAVAWMCMHAHSHMYMYVYAHAHIYMYTHIYSYVHARFFKLSLRCFSLHAVCKPYVLVEGLRWFYHCPAMPHIGCTSTHNLSHLQLCVTAVSVGKQLGHTAWRGQRPCSGSVQYAGCTARFRSSRARCINGGRTGEWVHAHPLGLSSRRADVRCRCA